MVLKIFTQIKNAQLILIKLVPVRSWLKYTLKYYFFLNVHMCIYIIYLIKKTQGSYSEGFLTRSPPCPLPMAGTLPWCRGLSRKAHSVSLNQCERCHLALLTRVVRTKNCHCLIQGIMRLQCPLDDLQTGYYFDCILTKPFQQRAALRSDGGLIASWSSGAADLCIPLHYR